MSLIAVCSLARLDETINWLKPWGIVTLLDPESMIDTPDGQMPDRHLKLGVNDISEARDGLIVPGADHVASLLEYGKLWDLSAPLVVHCWAGVSRSTASAFTIACLKNPETPEIDIARAIRKGSKTASPNLRLTEIADDMMGRGGRMVDSVRAIGRGASCWEGIPFEIPGNWDAAK